MSLLEIFQSRVLRHPERIALIDGKGRATTFAALDHIAQRLAGGWRQKGIAKGDRVLLAIPLNAHLYASLAALWRLGAVAVFPEPALGLGGLRHAAQVTRPKALLAGALVHLAAFGFGPLRAIPVRLTTGDHGARKDIAAQNTGGDPALLSFTSGATGAPKCIPRSHDFLVQQSRAVTPLLRPDAAPHKRPVDLVGFPVFVLANLGLGITSVLPNWDLRRQHRINAQALFTFARTHAVTRMLVPPSVCEAILHAPVIDNLSHIITGGGPVFPDIMQGLLAHVPHATVTAVYGSTEAEPIAEVNARDIRTEDWKAMARGAGLLAGRPVHDLSLRLIDHEIVVTGPHVNRGYLNPDHDRGTKLTLDGDIWHRTGDAGRLDGQGRLWLLGRMDGRVGEYFPFAVEVAARSWPGVRRCALVHRKSQPILAIEGDKQNTEIWKTRAAKIGNIAVLPVKTIPLDKRHRSKVDYPALRRKLNVRPHPVEKADLG